MLEFQDPPDFDYGGLAESGTTSNDNTTKFGRIFQDAITSLVALPNITDKVVGSAAHSGSDGGDSRSEPGVIPWPIASIIWKNGTQHGKEWIDNVHRSSAQDPGYGFGFTFRGHYKAVECDKLAYAFQKNGISLTNNFTSLNLANGLFKQYWNTFVDMEDMSPQFASSNKEAALATSCLADCVVAPCPDTIPATTTGTTTTNATTSNVPSRQLLGAWFVAGGGTMLLLLLL
jgi:hypothetical protein